MTSNRNIVIGAIAIAVVIAAYFMLSAYDTALLRPRHPPLRSRSRRRSQRFGDRERKEELPMTSRSWLVAAAGAMALCFTRTACLTHAVVGPQIHLLVLDAAPQPLDEYIVPPSSFSVHADGDVVLGQHAGEGRTRELRALVGVEDLGLAVARQSILQRLDAERSFHRDRQPPRHAGGSPIRAPRPDRRSRAPSGYT